MLAPSIVNDLTVSIPTLPANPVEQLALPICDIIEEPAIEDIIFATLHIICGIIIFINILSLAGQIGSAIANAPDNLNGGEIFAISRDIISLTAYSISFSLYYLEEENFREMFLITFLVTTACHLIARLAFYGYKGIEGGKESILESADYTGDAIIQLLFHNNNDTDPEVHKI